MLNRTRLFLLEIIKTKESDIAEYCLIDNKIVEKTDQNIEDNFIETRLLDYDSDELQHYFNDQVFHNAICNKIADCCYDDPLFVICEFIDIYDSLDKNAGKNYIVIIGYLDDEFNKIMFDDEEIYEDLK